MIALSPLVTIFSLRFLAIACFYLFRLVRQETWIHSLDAENEVGHAMMAVGMIFMLAPAGVLTPDLIRWNIILFAAAFLWFSGRLFTQNLCFLWYSVRTACMPRGVLMPFIR